MSERGADLATRPGQTPCDGQPQVCRTAKDAPSPSCLGSSSFAVSLSPLSRTPPSSFSLMHDVWDALLCLKVPNSSLLFKGTSVPSLVSSLPLVFCSPCVCAHLLISMAMSMASEPGISSAWLGRAQRRVLSARERHSMANATCQGHRCETHANVPGALGRGPCCQPTNPGQDTKSTRSTS